MGCGPSTKYDNIYLTVPKVRQYIGDFNALGISERDVGRLYGLFTVIDSDGSGCIEIIELLMFLDVERTRFTKRIFSMFDDDNSGEIDFREFVLSIWNYCTLGKTSLIVFAFDLYDQDKSGYIDVPEAQHLIKDVYGEKFHMNTHAKRVYYKIQELDKDLIDIETFQRFAEKHPALLYPAFEMQTRFQRKVIGPPFWHALIRARVRMFKDRYVPIKDILLMYADRYDVSDPYMGLEDATTEAADDSHDLVAPDESDVHELTPAQRQLEAARRMKLSGPAAAGRPSFKRFNTTGHEIVPISRGNSRGVLGTSQGARRGSVKRSESDATSNKMEPCAPKRRPPRSLSRGNSVMPSDAAALRRLPAQSEQAQPLTLTADGFETVAANIDTTTTADKLKRKQSFSSKYTTSEEPLSTSHSGGGRRRSSTSGLTADGFNVSQKGSSRKRSVVVTIDEDKDGSSGGPQAARRASTSSGSSSFGGRDRRRSLKSVTQAVIATQDRRKSTTGLAGKR
mmetsp:Transcript_1741/g.2724  ORF Transcript_1741/g.2724 Transcript_1741/m.2724 type:complete len:509 (-) Transcript_1741:189-1715(-)|eukprot:CAMPEP_0185036268 /NCGR_PEP_ID=MMETSP1103-20130426/28989_1 /TAXON_ID=36769 /ORGANISM="Paraphysomonas bandaiensis, Strain Caron Lab Isolate" /LENGTH=508 /DNA_ID=CAMNT_0027573753 /DNA_START=236 /DNA_END=1762 /DNA_ORIENTATION=-